MAFVKKPVVWIVAALVACVLLVWTGHAAWLLILFPTGAVFFVVRYFLSLDEKVFIAAQRSIAAGQPTLSMPSYRAIKDLARGALADRWRIIVFREAYRIRRRRAEQPARPLSHWCRPGLRFPVVLAAAVPHHRHEGDGRMDGDDELEPPGDPDHDSPSFKQPGCRRRTVQFGRLSGESGTRVSRDTVLIGHPSRLLLMKIGRTQNTPQPSSVRGGVRPVLVSRRRASVLDRAVFHQAPDGLVRARMLDRRGPDFQRLRLGRLSGGKPGAEGLRFLGGLLRLSACQVLIQVIMGARGGRRWGQGSQWDRLLSGFLCL